MMKFTEGQTVWMRGLDMNCYPVECKGTFVRYTDPTPTGFDCVVESDGIKIYDHSSSLFSSLELLQEAQ